MALNEIDLYKFRGKTYSTAIEIAEAYKVSPRKFRARMIAGWPIEEALEVVKRANPKGKSVAVDGEFFATRRDVAKHFGIEEGTLNKRLSDGWTIEEAVGLVARKALRVGNPKPCTFLGIKFASKTERNAHFGIENHSIDFIDKRLKRGFTERQAVGREKRECRRRAVRPTGVVTQCRLRTSYVDLQTGERMRIYERRATGQGDMTTSMSKELSCELSISCNQE